ncbi:MAG: hypothetical protein IJ065_06290 [Eubacterium sp.]|nr:hypothetical protein [Eubacterium sp.]
MSAKTGNPIVDLVSTVLEKQFENYNVPYHLLELEEAAVQQERVDLGGEGWDDDTIEAFILKWCRKYNGNYADEDVALVLRCHMIEPRWLAEVAKAVSEKHGGSPIYGEPDPRDVKLYKTKHLKFTGMIPCSVCDSEGNDLPF